VPKKLDSKVAEKMMLEVGLKPLEPYKSALTKWKCRCTTCKTIVYPKLNGIQQGRGGCTKCGYLNRNMPLKLSEKEAVKRMLKADLYPLEPYKSAVTKWKSKCLKCGKKCSPKLNAISSGQGGCINCGYKKAIAKNTFSNAKAKKLMIEYGYKPLVAYESSHTRWKSKCLKCSKVVYPKLSSLQSGQGGCGYCSKSLADIDLIYEIFKKNKVEPLVKKPIRMQEGWKCKCLRCKRIINVYVSNLYRGSDPCKFCSGKAVDPKSAVLTMKKASLKVLTPYDSAKTPWKSMCMKCKNIVYPMYSSIRNGQGGCMFCAEKGMDMTAPSYLYLIVHDQYGALKIGVGNVQEKKKTDRLENHRRRNWETFKIWNFNTGAEAYYVEQAVLTTLRIELQIPKFLHKSQMPQRGETETMDRDLVSLLEVERIVKNTIKAQKAIRHIFVP
jgi:hypothetical protein